MPRPTNDEVVSIVLAIDEEVQKPTLGARGMSFLAKEAARVIRETASRSGIYGADMNLSRRSLLVGAGATLITAPAIVRIASLMPVKVMTSLDKRTTEFEIGDHVRFRGEVWKVIGRSWQMGKHLIEPEITIVRYSYQRSIRSLTPKFANLRPLDLAFPLLSPFCEHVANINTSKSYLALAEEGAWGKATIAELGRGSSQDPAFFLAS